MLGTDPVASGPIAASATENSLLSVTSGTFTLSMQGAAKLITDIYPSGTFTYSGHPLLNPVALNIGADSGTFTYTFSTVGVSLGKGIVLDPIGTFTYSGHAVTMQKNLSPDAAVGVFTVTGHDIDVEIALTYIVNSGTFTLSGQDASVTAQRPFPVNQGTFTITGQSADVTAQRPFPLGTEGQYTVTGFDVKFKGWLSPNPPQTIWTEVA